MTEKIQHNVLVVSEEAALRRLVLETLADKAIHGQVAGDVKSAQADLADRTWDLVIGDSETIGDDVESFVRLARAGAPELPIVIVSEDRGVARAVRAMRAGCEDFLIKPLSRPKLQCLLETLLPNHKVTLAAGQGDVLGRYQIVGSSPCFLETLSVAQKVARTSMPVLITGESGTGKELISYFIHSRSRRSRGPYLRINCAAMSESLLDSELFGHERGAFTGAVSRRKGLFERAHGGTLLLDEISETPPTFQAKLLRVLEQQDFERVGGSEMVRVNVRVISTSNRDLLEQVRKGRFRRDLYYRLDGLNVTVPPLRDRPEDMLGLVWHFVNLYAHEVRRRIVEIDPGMMAVLSEYTWPGNIRQLRNVVRTALAMGQGKRLSLDGLADWRHEPLRRSSPTQSNALRLRDVERRAILEALRRTKSHYTKAANLLGITDRTLRDKVRRYRRDGYIRTVGENKWLTETA